MMCISPPSHNQHSIMRFCIPLGGYSMSLPPSPQQCCRKILDKYEITALDSSVVTTSYERQGDDDEFYAELKQEVNRYFRDNKVRMFCGIAET
jgi:hypothetical protein